MIRQEEGVVVICRLDFGTILRPYSGKIGTQQIIEMIGEDGRNSR